MTRDMDLVRSILLKIESHPHGFAPKVEIEGFTEEQISYHVHIMAQAGLLVASEASGYGDRSPHSRASSITWQGHEFIDAAREPKRWMDAKTAIGKVGGATIAIWTTVLTKMAMQHLGIPT